MVSPEISRISLIFYVYAMISTLGYCSTHIVFISVFIHSSILSEVDDSHWPLNMLNTFVFSVVVDENFTIRTNISGIYI